MIKLKQMTMVAVMGAALLCSGVAMAAGCAKTQYLNGSKCVNCPTGAKCDGKTFKCDTKNRWSQSGSKCVCNGYWKKKSDKDPHHCYECPKNATCNGGNGSAGIKCNSGYKLSGEQCVADKNAKCGKNEWMDGKKCTACPANATCKDGKTFACNKGFTQKGNTCITSSSTQGECTCRNGAKTCKNGHLGNVKIKGRYTAPGNILASNYDGRERGHGGDYECQNGKLRCGSKHSHAIVKTWGNAYKVYCECDKGYHLGNHRKDGNVEWLEYFCRKD